MESENRLGGRIYSDHVRKDETSKDRSFYCNLGAHFVNGCDVPGCNLLMDFIREHRIRTEDVSHLTKEYFTGTKIDQLASLKVIEKAQAVVKVLFFTSVSSVPLLITATNVCLASHQLKSLKLVSSDVFFVNKTGLSCYFVV